MIATSGQFPKCMSEQVFEKICFRKPASAADKALVAKNANSFKNGGFLLKDLFIDTALDCME